MHGSGDLQYLLKAYPISLQMLLIVLQKLFMDMVACTVWE